MLLTGGAGFIGSHLSRRLLKQGHAVLCVDYFFTRTRSNIDELLDHKGFQLRLDMTFPLYVEVDETYNLVCPASPVHNQFDPVKTTKSSVVRTINMLGLAKRLKVPPAGLCFGGVRRYRGASADRELPVQRQFDWYPLVLR